MLTATAVWILITCVHTCRLVLSVALRNNRSNDYVLATFWLYQYLWELSIMIEQHFPFFGNFLKENAMNKRCIHLISSSVYFSWKLMILFFINSKYSASYTFQMIPKMLGKGHYSKAFFQCSLFLLMLCSSHPLKKYSNKVTHYFSDEQRLNM